MNITLTIEQRSRIMRQVKSKGNKSTELKVMSLLKSNSIKGWRRNYKLFGKPDFAFPKSKIALFIDGCFWHGHNCRNLTPKNNKEYWETKIQRNKNRDEEVNAKLRLKGWKVIRIWECKIDDYKFKHLLHI